MHIGPGQPYPLGATWDGAGVNFALFSAHASGVDLCLFDTPESPHERLRLPLTACTDEVWHGYVPEMQPGRGAVPVQFTVPPWGKCGVSPRSIAP